jgi:hypothetical protein
MEDSVMSIPATILGTTREHYGLLALEVERVSENQRFATRLLSERSPVILPRPDAKNVTPH